MSERDGAGSWNRGGRRGGGDVRRPLLGARPANDAPVIGPCCAMGRHDICAGDCVCECHARARPGTEPK